MSQIIFERALSRKEEKSLFSKEKDDDVQIYIKPRRDGLLIALAFLK